MPVTARLSRGFYERFGDEVTNELVEWLNSVDASFQTSLRDLNEANFARSDARTQQRFAVLESKIEQRFATFEGKMELRFATFQGEMEQRFAMFEARMGAFEAKIAHHISGLATKEELSALATKEELSALARSVEGIENRLLRWMIGFWTTSLLAMIGLFVAALQLR